MSEILGLGMTHWPPLAGKDERLASTFRVTLTSPNVPDRYKDRANWPAEFLRELGDDDGASASRAYGARMADDFRTMRRILDDFAPDIVLVWGDDQYENFREDVVPPFCIFGLDDPFPFKPWDKAAHPNRWDEPADWTRPLRGHRDAAKHLSTGLIREGFDVAYAYKPLHIDGLGHAFRNTVLYLDWDRKGFPYPIIPMSVNCYGSSLFRAKGGLNMLFEPPQAPGEFPDPPGPQPWRCMDLGAAVARCFAASPWRVALIASASWSHSFLTTRNGYMWADVESDRRLYEALERGDYESWRRCTLDEMTAAGQHEMLNWMALVGAMEELGRRPVIHDYVESHLFTSQKCFASFPAPHGAARR
jgi:hypothetical protein